jgi:predicted CoA-substrate-specific enzyme activase
MSNLLVAGVDAGSTTAKAVVLDEASRVLGTSLIDSSPDLATSGRDALNGALREAGATDSDLAFVVGTGYGRASLPFATRRVTEITCHAAGASMLLPDVRMVVDVGGQDSKVIRLGESGEVLDFAMNDKCSAGTGRFLNAMAATLRTGLEELGPTGLKSQKVLSISSTCTVFAESEVISLIAQGEKVPDIAHALHAALARRLAGMVRLVGADSPALFSGGGALNPDLVKCLEGDIGLPFHIPPRPQITGALVAARLALRYAGGARIEAVAPPDGP